MTVDRREAHALMSKPQLIAVSMDIDSLAGETYRSIDTAYQAHLMDDWPRFLHSIGRAGEKVTRIGKIARDLSGFIEGSPDVDPNQLEVWTRSDGAVVSTSGTAA